MSARLSMGGMGPRGTRRGFLGGRPVLLPFGMRSAAGESRSSSSSPPFSKTCTTGGAGMALRRVMRRFLGFGSPSSDGAGGGGRRRRRPQVPPEEGGGGIASSSGSKGGATSTPSSNKEAGSGLGAGHGCLEPTETDLAEDRIRTRGRSPYSRGSTPLPRSALAG